MTATPYWHQSAPTAYQRTVGLLPWQKLNFEHPPMTTSCLSVRDYYTRVLRFC